MGGVQQGISSDPSFKAGYRPVSVFPPVTKVVERLMQKQLNEHIKNKLSPYLCGYRKGFSRQYALLSLIEYWKKSSMKKDLVEQF